MAEPSGSSSTPASTASNRDPPQPTPSHHDWEMLSMSMAASAYATPGSAPVSCVCDFCTGRASAFPASCLAASRAVSNSPPRLAPQGAEKSVTKASTVESSPAVDSNERDEATQQVASPRLASDSGQELFSDGWKPQRGSFPADFIIRDLAPTTLPQYAAISDAACGDECKKDIRFMDKAIYAVDADVVLAIDEGRMESPSKSTSVEREKEKKKSVKAWRAWLWKVQAPDASTVWSLALAASVVGIVLLGYRWHRERCQNQQLRIQLSTQDEKIGDLHYQVNRLKDIITGRRRVHVTRTSF